MPCVSSTARPAGGRRSTTGAPTKGGRSATAQLEDGYLLCPWHTYQYDPVTGKPPPGFVDAATAYPVRDVADSSGDLELEIPAVAARVSLMDQVVDVLCDWGLDACFGMVGHSNLGMADALARRGRGRTPRGPAEPRCHRRVEP